MSNIEDLHSIKDALAKLRAEAEQVAMRCNVEEAHIGRIEDTIWSAECAVESAIEELSRRMPL